MYNSVLTVLNNIVCPRTLHYTKDADTIFRGNYCSYHFITYIIYISTQVKRYNINLYGSRIYSKAITTFLRRSYLQYNKIVLKSKTKFEAHSTVLQKLSDKKMIRGLELLLYKYQPAGWYHTRLKLLKIVQRKKKNLQ